MKEIEIRYTLLAIYNFRELIRYKVYSNDNIIFFKRNERKIRRYR